MISVLREKKDIETQRQEKVPSEDGHAKECERLGATTRRDKEGSSPRAFERT